MSYCSFNLRFSRRTYWSFLDGIVVKNLPDNAGAVVRFLGSEDPLEEEMATHASNFAWKIPE